MTRVNQINININSISISLVIILMVANQGYVDTIFFYYYGIISFHFMDN
jgi:hypothetical protein